MKILLGIPIEVDAFDNQLIEFIKSEILDLSNLIPDINEGVVYEKDVRSIEYLDFLPSILMAAPVERLMYFKIKLDFDPPSNSSVLQSMKDSITKAEYMLIRRFDN